VAYLFALMMTSLCQNYWQFMLAQGILTGISNGLLLFPAMTATTQYFNKNRGAAMGMAIAGSSLGAVVFPILLSKLLNDSTVGFGWSVRISGFVMIPFLVFAAIAIKARLPPRGSRFFLWSAFRMPLYDVLIVASFFLFIGMFVPLFYLPTYGVFNGMSESMASYLVAMINGASIPGRIIPGVLGDRVGRLNALFAAGLSSAILIFCWPEAVSTAGIIVFSIAFGFCSGAIISGGSVAFTLCPKDPKEIGTYMGMGMAIASLAALIGPPVNGALLRTYGSFNQVSWFSGAMCMTGAVLVLAAKAQTSQGVFGKI
jgi:MFS family permease